MQELELYRILLPQVAEIVKQTSLVVIIQITAGLILFEQIFLNTNCRKQSGETFPFLLLLKYYNRLKFKIIRVVSSSA